MPDEKLPDVEGHERRLRKLEAALVGHTSSLASTGNALSLDTDLDDLGSVKTYLTIEKPDQTPGTPPADVYYLYGYRTRRVQMTATSLVNSMARWPDGSTTTLVWSIRMPVDWVVGTDVTLNVQMRPRATGTAVLNSYITAWANGETETSYNIENAVAVGFAGTDNVIFVRQRTIAGADLQADDAIYWNLIRLGADGGDTMAGNLDAFYGAYMEYVAWF